MSAGAAHVTVTAPSPAVTPGAAGAPGAAAGVTLAEVTLAEVDSPQPAPVSASTSMVYVDPLVRLATVQVRLGAATWQVDPPGVAVAR